MDLNEQTATTPVSIAGAGRVGQALGRALTKAGQPVSFLASRTPEQAQRAAAFIAGGVRPVCYEELAGNVLLCVSDDALEEVAGRLTGDVLIALHTSGARGPEALAPLLSREVACGSLHPLQTFPTPEAGVQGLPGSTFAIAGDDVAAEWARRLVLLLDGKTIAIAPGRHALYHAAAVMASNYVVALLGAAETLMELAGVPRQDGLPALAPLVRAAVDNTIALGPAAALTGPVQRGDARTVASHLDALESAPPEVLKLYRAAARQTLVLARERGLAEEHASAIHHLVHERN